MKCSWIIGIVIAAAVMAASLFTASQPALAQQEQVTCQRVDVNGPTPDVRPFDTQVQYCGTASKITADSMQNALSQVTSRYADAGPKLRTANPQVYLFHNPAEYASFMGTNALKVDPSWFSNSFFDANTVPLYSVVFEQNGAGATNPEVDNTAAHEMGVWLDYLYARKLSRHFPLASDSRIWADEAAQDWASFNALNGACTGPDNVFSGKRAQDGTFVCSGQDGTGATLNPQYSNTTNNREVLNLAWPNTILAVEMWAEEAAVGAGVQDNGGDGIDTYFTRNSNFTCTQTLERSLLQYGAKPGQAPSPYKRPQGCPAN